MDKEQAERYKQERTEPADETALDAASHRIQTNYADLVSSGPSHPDIDQIFKDIARIDRMGRATVPEAEKVWRALGKNSRVSQALTNAIERHDLSGDNEEVLELTRVAHLMGKTFNRPWETFLLNIGLGERFHIENKAAANFAYRQRFERNKAELEAKRRAAAAGAGGSGATGSAGTGRRRSSTTGAGGSARASGSGTGPSTGPSAGPSRGPSTTASTGPSRPTGWIIESQVGKSPEWVSAWDDTNTRWDALKAQAGFPTEATLTDTLKRFELAIDLIKGDILRSATLSRAVRLRARAQLEYLIPKIWSTPDNVTDFLDKYRPTPDTAVTLRQLSRTAKVLFLDKSEWQKTVPPTEDNKKLFTRLFRAYSGVYHPNNIGAFPDTNANLKDYIDLISKRVNDEYSVLKKLR